jgi:hypothetical protein
MLFVWTKSLVICLQINYRLVSAEFPISFITDAFQII